MWECVQVRKQSQWECRRNRARGGHGGGCAGAGGSIGGRGRCILGWCTMVEDRGVVGSMVVGWGAGCPMRARTGLLVHTVADVCRGRYGASLLVAGVLCKSFLRVVIGHG